MTAGDLLPDRPEFVEARRVIDTAVFPPDGDGSWEIGYALVDLMAGCSPYETSKEAKREQRFRLLQLIEGRPEASLDRLREYWVVAYFIDRDLRVEGKSWDDHRRALYRSDRRRDKYDPKLALRLLAGDEAAEAEVDPFAGAGLNTKQHAAALRLWGQVGDLADPAVIKAVAAELRGPKKKGLNVVANAAHAHVQAKLKAAEDLAALEGTNWALDLVNHYYQQLLRTADASYNLKLIFEKANPDQRQAVKIMIEGGTISALKALDALLDMLISE